MFDAALQNWQLGGKKHCFYFYVKQVLSLRLKTSKILRGHVPCSDILRNLWGKKTIKYAPNDNLNW